MITASFRGMPGIGPSREKELWSKGYRSWDDLPESGLILSPRIDLGLRRAVNECRELLEQGALTQLADRLPVNERWRLWPRLVEQTVFLDIETDGESDTVTSVGLFDSQGPTAFVRGWNLGALPEALARYEMVVTFNGSSFDLPVLRRSFPGLKVPPIHIDLRFLFRRIGETGGLKKLEARLGLSRPGAVEGVDGWEAVLLWRRWLGSRDIRALATLVEYNLYDAIQLRPLLDMGYNRMVELSGGLRPYLPVWQRGGELYDVSRVLDEIRRGVRL